VPKILVVNYSQTGQLTNITRSITLPLEKDPNIQIDCVTIQPLNTFPFPWPFLQFFHIFPECVKMTPQPIKEIPTNIVDSAEEYDLILLAYQVWFLSPSLPISSFLQSNQAKTIFNGKPVVTIIGCRGMWLGAQEKVKKLLSELKANLVDNVVLTDNCGTAFSFLATPLWMFTGRKKAYSWAPRAGVSDEDVKNAGRFGKAIRSRLNDNNEIIKEPMLKNMGAVNINEKFIASERVGQHSFKIWSTIISAIGPMYSTRRSLGLVIYIVFLLTLILTVVPIFAIVKRMIAPLTQNKISQQRAYFAEPSGE